jgi:hypothetical protein
MTLLSCKASDWRSPKDPTLLDMIGTAETKQTNDAHSSARSAKVVADLQTVYG